MISIFEIFVYIILFSFVITFIVGLILIAKRDKELDKAYYLLDIIRGRIEASEKERKERWELYED